MPGPEVLNQSYLNTALATIFKMAYAETARDAITAPTWPELCETVKSTTSEHRYVTLGSTARLQEWIDERQPKRLTEQRYSLENKTYEASILIGRDELADDQFGEVKRRVQQLAESAYQEKELLFAATVIAGVTSAGLCYDGQQMYDSDHVDPASEYTTAQDNDETQTLGAAGIKAAIIKMRKFRDDRGRKAGVIPSSIMVPIDLEADLYVAIESELLPGGTNNDKNIVTKYGLKPLVNIHLEDVNCWYLNGAKQFARPFVFQEREKIKNESLGEGTSLAVVENSYLFGIKERMVFGYGDWRLSIRNNPS